MNQSRLSTAVLQIIVVAGCAWISVLVPGCIGYACLPGDRTDAAFAGDWSNSAVTLLVGHMKTYFSGCSQYLGHLRGAGYNTKAGATWQKMSFTAEVIEVGRANALVTLWKTTGAANDTRVASFSATMIRTGEVLTLVLDYTTSDGASHQETHQLKKKP